MIARDTGRTVKVGLEVYDKDGRKVGYVDQVSDAQGWMQVEALGLGLQRLWIPYRLIKSVDGGEVIVTLTKAELRAGCANPPARNTEVVHRDGRVIAVTYEAGGRPGIMAIVGRGSGIAQIGPFRLRGFIGWLFWLTYHILILDTIRARFTALINWAALFLFREPPLRLDVSAKRREAPD